MLPEYKSIVIDIDCAVCGKCLLVKAPSLLVNPADALECKLQGALYLEMLLECLVVGEDLGIGIVFALGKLGKLYAGADCRTENPVGELLAERDTVFSLETDAGTRGGAGLCDHP